MNYDIGDRRKLTIEVRDETGDLADPDALRFEMTTPDGQTASYILGTDAELVRDSEGCFHVYWDCAQDGIHRYKWIASGSLAVVEASSFLVGTSEDLSPFDVEVYTKGRLPADDPETQRALDAALATVRDYCQWHVTPVRSETLTVRGRGYSDIKLPTKNIVSIESVTENGEPVDLDSITIWRNTLTKVSGCWCGVVEVALSHGFTADESANWRDVVLHIVDRETFNAGEGGSGELIHKQVDDVQVRWAGGSFEELYSHRLARYTRQWWVA